MNCPKCGDELQTTLRHGVRIDLCPTCQGKWFEQGELERLMKRMSVLERRQVCGDDTGGYRGL